MRSWVGQYCIYVSDLDAAVAFFEAIGLTCTSRTAVDESTAEAIVENPDKGGKLQLAQRLDDTAPIGMGNAFWKLYVNTNDIDTMYGAALDFGVEAHEVKCVERLDDRKAERWAFREEERLRAAAHRFDLILPEAALDIMAPGPGHLGFHVFSESFPGRRDAAMCADERCAAEKRRHREKRQASKKNASTPVEIAKPPEQQRKPGGRKREGRGHPGKVVDPKTYGLSDHG